MEGLETVLQEFYGPGGDTARKREIEAELVRFRDSPEAFQHAFQFLQASDSPYVQWFSAMVFEDTVQRRWHTLDNQSQEQVRVFVLQYLTDANRRLEPYVASKLQKVVVDIAKVGGWPQRYPNFLPDVLSLCQSPATFGTGLALLAMLGVEFVREDLPLPSRRKQELQAAFTSELPAIVQLLSTLLTHAHEAASSAPDALVQSDLACAALRCLSVLVEWPAMAPCLSPELCANVFRVVQAAVRPGNEALTPSGLAAIQVMTEVLNKKCVPKQLEDFVMNVAMQMCLVLESLLTERPGGLDSMEEELLLALCEFLTVFLDQHLGRVLAVPKFPFKDFIVLLGKFTFQLPNGRLLRRALVPWATLLEHLTESEAGLLVLQDTAHLLSQVASALLQKVLFVTNGPMLADLDDEAVGGGGDGKDAAAGGGEDGHLLVLEEEEAPAFQFGLTSYAMMLGGELSEQQEVIAEGVALLQSFARLPTCSQDLGNQVLKALGEAFQALDSTSSSSSSSQGHDVAHTVTDCSTLLSLVLVIVPQAPAEPFWAALRLVLSSAHRMGEVRLYSRGAVFLRLQGAALVALRDLTRGFDSVLSSSSSSSSSSAAAMEGVVTETIGVIRQCLDTTISPAPEVLQREAATLLLALSQKLPAELLRSFPAVVQVMTDMYRLVAPLPLAVQERIVQAVSFLLLPNAAARSTNGEEEAAIASSYISFVSPLVSTLKDTQGEIDRGEVLTQENLLELRRAARILRGLCTLYAQTPKRIKAILFGAVIPALPALLPCLSYCLSKLAACSSTTTTTTTATGAGGSAIDGSSSSSSSSSSSAASAATAAQSLLGLLMAVHGCFGKELGPTFMPEAIQRFVQLFASAEFTASLSQQLAAAQQYTHRRTVSDGSYSRSISVFILASLLRLLTQISSDRTSTPPGIIAPICRLMLEKLVPLVKAAPTDLLPLLLRLIGSLLSDHWKEFMTGNGGGNGQGRKNTPPGGGRIHHQFSGGGNGGDQQQHQQKQLEKEKRQFTSLEMQEAFNGMLLVAYMTIQDTSLPPGTVRQAIELLQKLNNDISLFSLEHFRMSMQLPYALTMLELLLGRTHPLLREELIALLREMTVAVDVDWTFDTLLPQVLLKVEELTNDQRNELLNSLPRDMKDAPTFAKSINAFLSDIAYARMINQAENGNRA